MGHVIHELSRYNVANFSVTADEDSLAIKGKVYRDPGFGSGGSYKARVTAYFVSPVEVLTRQAEEEICQQLPNFVVDALHTTSVSDATVQNSLNTIEANAGILNALL